MDNDFTFRLRCQNGHIEVAKWLYSLDKIDIHAFEDDVFRYSCQNGHIEVGKWLCTLTDKYIITNEKTCEYKIIKSPSILMKKLIDPKKHLFDIHIDEKCIICLSEEQYMIQLECKHIYCCACLKHYLELEKTKCCYCQKDIDENSDKHLIYHTE